MKKFISIIIAFIFSLNLNAQTYLFGSEAFDTDFIVHGSTAPTTSWFAPSYNTPIDFISGTGCPLPCIGYSGNWNNYWGNFVRLPEVNCTGYDSVIMAFDVSHSFFSTQLNNWCRFYVWADGAYKHIVSSVKINGSDALYNSGANGKGFRFTEARTCAHAEITFNLSSISDRSNLLFYIEGICQYNNSNTYYLYIDNLGILAPALPPVTPGIQASDIVFSNILPYQFDAVWTRGNGSNCLAFVKDTIDGSPFPSDNLSYAAAATFMTGQQIGSSGWYCVYNGNSNSVTVSNLQENTTYRMMVCEYNGSPGQEKYNTSLNTLNPNNVKTDQYTAAALPQQASISIKSAGENLIIHSPETISYVMLLSPDGKMISKTTGSGKSAVIKKPLHQGVFLILVKGRSSSFCSKYFSGH